MTQCTAARRVGMLYTGGTFGMVASQRGLVPSSDLPARAEKALDSMGLTVPHLSWLDHGWPPLASSDLAPALWYDLAQTIVRASDCDGFVVIHGTDTLAYTGAALSYLLAGLGRPVVVTGAQAPLGEQASDAATNLADALTVAAQALDSGVTVAFGRQLFRANRVSKRFGTAEQPFSSPCVPPITDLSRNAHLTPVIPARPDWGSLSGAALAAAWRPVRITVLPVYPGIDGTTVAACARAHPDGILLEGYAAGLGPGGHSDFVDAVADTVASGTIVAATADSAQGTVRMGKYATSTPLAEAGVVGGADITREAALTKLHVSLCAGLGHRRAAPAFARNQCGELTPAG